MKPLMTTLKRSLLAICLLVGPSTAGAGVIDIAGPGLSGTDTYQPNGTSYSIIYTQINPQSTGTGVIDPFAQIGQPGGSLLVEQAYNTTVSKILDNGSSANWNHELLLTNVPIATVGGINYREFLLDVNEEGNIPDRYLSLSEVQVYLSNSPNQKTETFNSDGSLPLGTLIYSLDGIGTKKTLGDDYVKLDYKLNHGSGSGDMLLLIPDALFKCSGKDCDKYVYLYSKFGEPNTDGLGQSDGFEEWSTCVDPKGGAKACTGSTSGTNTSGSAGSGASEVPEPSSMLLLGAGLLLAGRVVRKKPGSN